MSVTPSLPHRGRQRKGSVPLTPCFSVGFSPTFFFTNLLSDNPDMEDAAIAKGMAGSRKCFDIFELPERRGLSLKGPSGP